MNKLVFLSMVLFSNIMFAQENKFTLSPEIGYTINFPEMNNSMKPRNSLGAHLGINIYLALNKSLSFGTAVLYNTHRTQFQYKVSNLQLTTFSSFHINYIRLPLNLNYHYKLGKGSLVFNMGPYFGLGVLGDWDSVSRNYYTGDSYTQKKKIDWGNGPQQINPIDYGLNLGVSYAFRKGLFFKAQYSRSFSTYSVYHIRDIQNQFVTVAVGYNISFGKNQVSKNNENDGKP